MQQTEHLKLNLIETGDPLSPAPINENAEKLEAALATKTDETRTDGLEQRVVALEAHKMAVGSYDGDNASSRDIELGFKPQILFIMHVANGTPTAVFQAAKIMQGSNVVLQITENGFHVGHSRYDTYNCTGVTYNFLALA